MIIEKLKTYGTRSSGFKIYAHFKGYGLLPVLIDYETALELGEIKNPDEKLNRHEAIAKLNDTEIEGRKIAVNEAKPREDRRDSFKGGQDRNFHRNSRGRGNRN